MQEKVIIRNCYGDQIKEDEMDETHGILMGKNHVKCLWRSRWDQNGS